ncbi:MAG: NADP-dependent isocitrate dehydrogenase, partial [Lachnospiraceae bacterium]|nr:NADP-dependent isocitrate dehydrogenase [Lachnospiraceae bacterium]
KASLMVEDAEGRCVTQEVHEFKAPGILQGMHNTEKSIESFARSCFSYALDQKLDLWFSAKDTISKVYDGEFRDVFDRIYEEEYKAAFEQAGLTYFYTLIDDAVARAIRSEGGFVWALKNYDGDVMSDMMATAFGSLAMMTSVLVSPDGCYEYEAAHGTVQRHYYRYQRGEKTSTNSVATIYAWAGALKKRGELDALPELTQFGEKLEQAALQTIAKGKMTGDLAAITTLPAQSVRVLDSEEFIKAIREELQAQL